jgi:hypothetical protein
VRDRCQMAPPLGTVPRRLQRPWCRFNGTIISVG